MSYLVAACLREAGAADFTAVARQQTVAPTLVRSLVVGVTLDQFP